MEAYNAIINYSNVYYENLDCRTKKVVQAISMLKKDNKIVNKFKKLEKILERYKPMQLDALISDFATKLDKSVNNLDNARYVADFYDKLSQCAALAYIESFNVISSKFVDNKFIEASKEFVKTAKEFVEEHEIIALSYIVQCYYIYC